MDGNVHLQVTQKAGTLQRLLLPSKGHLPLVLHRAHSTLSNPYSNPAIHFIRPLVDKKKKAQSGLQSVRK